MKYGGSRSDVVFSLSASHLDKEANEEIYSLSCFLCNMQKVYLITRRGKTLMERSKDLNAKMRYRPLGNPSVCVSQKQMVADEQSSETNRRT